MKQKLLLHFIFLFTLFALPKANAQALGPGDIAFIGYNTGAPSDGFSFITLKDIPAATVIYFTEQGWGAGTWVAGSTESHLQWIVPAFTPAGTIVSVTENATADTFTVTGTSGIGLVAGYTGFNLAAGDQILAYTSVSGAKPVSPNQPTFLAGVNGDYNSADFDPVTHWNLSTTSGGPSSALPLGLTNGVNCVALFPANQAEIANNKYDGTLTGTVAELLAKINDYTTWIHDASTNYTITPASYPTPAVTTTVLATVATSAATNVRSVSATLGGQVTADGGDASVERGIVWATTASPTTSNTKVQIGTGTGTFSAIITGLPAGTLIHFRAYAKNSSGTSYGNDLTFTTGTALGTSSTSQVNILCNGGNNGSATVVASGGSAPYSYAWAPTGGTGATASNLLAGNYTVTITDNESTSITRNFTITEPSLLTALSSQTNITCNGAANGSATVTPSGGTGPYTYSWAPSGGTAATASNLAAGTYTVTIKDNNNCQITRNFTFNEPAVLDATAGAVTNVTCNGGTNGTAKVNVSGGTAPYTYSWAPTGGTAATATGLSAGTYTVTVTDANGCQDSQAYIITQPSALVASFGSQTDILCNGGSTGTATVNVSGGTPSYTYSWAPTGGTAATATGLVAGIYTVTVKDANNCTTTQSFTITQPPILIATPVAQTNVACNGGNTGSATISATGGTGTYTYSWAPSGGNGPTANGLTAGTYTVTVTDANSCTATKNFTITQPSAMVISPSQSNVSCNGGANGSATASVTGGVPSYSYAWAPSGGTGATAAGLSAGTYAVTVTDAYGCTATQNYTITEPTAINITPSQTNVSCNGGSNGSATVNVSGGTGAYTYSWAPSGGNTATASGLLAGTYTVTVTDANNCMKTQSFTITQPSPLTATTSKTDVLCNGGATGTATVTATGGTGSYTYVWSPSGGTAATATGLVVGNYSCTITDSNGCFITKNFTINQPSVLTATTSQINATCSAGGQAVVTPSGGAGGYTYLWSPGGATTQVVSGLATGNHSCIITDANGCTITKNFIISTTNTLVASTFQTNVLCNGNNTGSAGVIPSGAPGPYTYVWSPSGGSADTATNLTAGNYSVTITSSNGCSIIKNFTISQPNAMTVTPSQTGVSCNGGSNGSASVSVTGGTGGYTYSWAPSGGNGATALGLSAGTYTVTIKDANLCQKTQSFTITEPAAITATKSQTNVSCNGGANGSATVSPTGGTGAYSYLWMPSGGTSATASGLTAGTYTVTIKDANLCQITETFTISEPAVLSATSSQTNISCNGANNGTASVSVTGGTGTYTYLWSSGASAATATGLSPGNYSVVITDANGCTLTQNFTINQPSALSATVSQSNASCNGGTNGVASVNVTGGTGTYSYTWSPSGGNSNTATGLSAGNYSVLITDANGCALTQNFTISEPDALVLAPSKTDVSCNGANNGTASVSVSGGTGAYTYSWAPSGGTSNTATGLSPNNYTVTVTDANGCTATKTITIEQPEVLAATPSQSNITCNGANNGTASVSVSGGTGAYIYSWSPSGGTSNTATGLSPGNYSVLVTDANGCTLTQNFTISQPSALLATTAQTNVSCNGLNNGTASIIVTGGTGSYTYLWSPAGGILNTASGLSPGNYTVTATDENSCSITKSFTITEPTLLVATPSQTNVSCYNGANGSASVNVAGGTGSYTYLWSPSGGTANTANGLSPGTYNVTITDANSCSITQTFVITAPANPVSLTTLNAANVTVSDANLSGTVNSDGINRDNGSCLSEVGFVYATHANPTVADIKINKGSSLGAITSSITGLKGNTTYYVKTYAINSNGYVNYGNEISFTTEKYKLFITATAGLSKVYGTTDPIFSFTANGFANGDTNAILTGKLSRDTGENVGTYSIKAGTINAGANYIIVFAGATFEIIKANQTITWTQSLDLGCDTGNTAQLTATSSSGLPISYVIANTAIGEIVGTTLNIKNSGNTTITASQNGDQNYNPATSVTRPVVVSQSGLIIQQWADVLLADNKNKNYVAWQWYKNGALVSGATRQYYSENQALNGTYYVIATDKNGNSIKSCPLVLTGAPFSKTLKIYPNPVRALNEFTVECNFSESQLSGATLAIFNVTGTQIQTVSNVKAKNQVTAPSQSGIYIVLLTLSNGEQKTINLLVI
ncbi:MBG domain-containing protein [Flavobacterium sp. KACC 22761]|uniref:MBG domain-containing protein n=1 Tax=Flavobacterium sp. KACC 22761 TaxID=3092665 RepID=UPI002A75DFD1|nr:MBG domain-containing protein [Flavobacterium sp. KACC 22761]WPO78346.1 MBG domain-containing protein [Flavobacterium sp. KACC 22761]